MDDIKQLTNISCYAALRKAVTSRHHSRLENLRLVTSLSMSNSADLTFFMRICDAQLPPPTTHAIHRICSSAGAFNSLLIYRRVSLMRINTRIPSPIRASGGNVLPGSFVDFGAISIV